MRRIGIIGLIALLSNGALAQAPAISFPVKAVRFVVAFPPGGPTDLLARLIGQKLSDSLSQPFVIENVVGATGTIAHGQVAKAAPDGYTILMASTSSHIAAYLYKSMPYDPLKDFTPVINVATLPMALFVHPSMPATTLQEFIQLVKAKPDAFNFASPGSGSAGHLVTERFLRLVDLKVMHVPFKGAAPASTATIAGQTQVLFDTISTSWPHVKAGKLRALAVTTGKRSPAVPELPTMAEAGVNGFEASLWFAVFAPAATPAAIVAKLNGEITKALGAADIQARIAGTGGEFSANTAQQFAASLGPDTEAWVKIIRDTGARVD
ncbi:MAG: Bug family tripartite tricarboxylate transporter substrate binding protein [Burkholderiales bacterium]